MFRHTYMSPIYHMKLYLSLFLLLLHPFDAKREKMLKNIFSLANGSVCLSKYTTRGIHGLNSINSASISSTNKCSGISKQYFLTDVLVQLEKYNLRNLLETFKNLSRIPQIFLFLFSFLVVLTNIYFHLVRIGTGGWTFSFWSEETLFC